MRLPSNLFQYSPTTARSRFLTALLPTLSVIAGALFMLPTISEATCLDFNPWYDMIEVQPNQNLNLSQMTAEAWIRLTQDRDLASGYAVLDKNIASQLNPDPSDSNYLLFIEGTNDYLGNPSQHAHSVGWSIGNGTSFARVYSQTKTPDLEGEWHHISGTYDGNALRLYLDGELEASVQIQMEPVQNDGLLTLGWSPVGYLLSWYGRLDEVRIWNISRSQADIKQTMNVRMTGSEPGLVAYWNFDEGSGQVAHDIAGSDNHGQLGSTPNVDDQDPDWDAMTAPCDRPLKIVSTSPLPAAKMSEAYTFTFQAEGGFWHYSWELVSGLLPAGLAFSEGGILSGTPQEYGDFNFTVRVTDQGNPPASDSAAFDLHVAVPDLVITTSSLPDGVEGMPYNQTLQAQGGIPPYRWSIGSGNLPEGLSLNAITGTISGTPTNAAIGTSVFAVLVKDSQSPPASDEQSLSITIAPSAELTITTVGPLPDAKVGDEYDFAFTAQGGKLPYAWDIADGALPAGLSLSGGGLLSGTPGEYGDFALTVRVTDSQQPTQTKSEQVVLHVDPADLVIETTFLPSGVEDVAYSHALHATGGVPPYSWRLSSGSLPPGLSLNASTGVVNGTPTNAAIGNWAFTIAVSDSQSPAAVDDRSFSITVAAGAPLRITSSVFLPEGKVGEAYAYTFSAIGGKVPYSWQVASGSLPASLSLSSDGQLTGTPGSYGNFTFTVRVADSQQTPDSDVGDFSVTILPADLSISTLSLPDATEGAAYNQALTATGGIPPYMWQVISGSLPQALTLSGAGIITGTPTNSAIGISTFTVLVTDSQSQPVASSRILSIVVSPARPLSITTASPLPGGKVGEEYTTSLAAVGGKLPYTWSIESGSLPEGLSLSASGVISGTPARYGIAQFSVRVSDSQQPHETQTALFTISVAPADLQITTSSLPDGTEGVFYEQMLQAAGGVAPFRWSVSVGALPDGLILNSDTGRIAGTPTNAAIGVLSFTVIVFDSQVPASRTTRDFFIRIAPAAPVAILTDGNLPDGKVGDQYSAKFNAAGGKLPHVWRIVSGNLATGLEFLADGVLTGTPTQYGDFSFVAEVADSQSAPETASRQFVLHVKPADLVIVTSSLPDGREGVVYSQELEATGGVAPYAWEIISGSLPQGLGLGRQDGTISGTPANAAIGTSVFTISVTDGQSPAAMSNLVLSITIVSSSQLGITSASPLPDGKVGEQYTHTFAASGGKLPYTWSLDSGTVPPGLSLSAQGELAGTPGQHGDFTFSIVVKDSQVPESKVTKPFALHVAPSDLRIVTASLPGGVEGSPYSQAPEARGGVGPYSWRIVGGVLPQGLALDPATGLVSGTPTNAAIGVSSFTVRVEDSQQVAAHDEKQFSLEILPAEALSITTTSPLPQGKVGDAYNYVFVAKGGKLPYAWLFSSGVLPGGLNLSSDGILAGTPTEHGDFTFTVEVSDSQIPTETVREPFALHISPANLRITTASLPDGAEGASYAATVEAVGGLAPLTWSLAAGALPDGLTLNPSTGAVSGVPTNSAIGTSGFTLRVVDSQSPAKQDERAFSITVTPAQDLAITSTSPIPNGKVGVAYHFAFSACGGKLPYSWSIESGSLPAGLALSLDATLSGTPTQYGDFTFGVRATDSQVPSDTASMSFSLHITPEELDIITLSLPDGKEGTFYSETVKAKGGVAPYTWRIVSGNLPEGLKLDATTGVVSGTPTNAAIGKCTFTVRVSDRQSPSDLDEQPFTIIVSPQADLQIISTSPLPDGKVEEPFAYAFSAFGGKRPYAWSIVSGLLPSGLTMTSSGQLAGTPTQQGNFTFTVRVLDSQEVRDTAERQFLLHIAPREIEIEVTPVELTFSTRRGGADPPSQTLTIRAIGGQQITWQALEGCSWLSLNPTTDVNAGEEDRVTVSIAKSGLDIGTYEAFVDVVPTEMPEKHKIVRVVLHVNPIKVPDEYSTIQAGIDAADSLDIVLVAPGTYYERIATKPDVRVIGSGPDRTTIDAQQRGTAVALMGDRSSVEGFTICNGIGDFYGNGSRVGGGVYCGASSTKISGCRIVSNTALQGWGGGVFVKSGCSVAIVESFISGNSAESGGAIFCHEGSRALVQASIIRENTGQWFGGGVCCINLSSAALLGCELSRNSAGFSGGAVAMKDQSELNVVNCTLADNLSDEGGGIFGDYWSSVLLTNSLLWNERTDLALLGKSAVRFCDIRDGSFAGTDYNFSLDPCFVNAAEGDYHLLPNSPCLDGADGNADDLPATDIDGEPRVLLSYAKLAPDIGADELDPETVFALVNSPVTVGGDGYVTVHYTLWNGRATPSSVIAEYSADSGATWHRATRAMTSEGTDSLTTSAAGMPHAFVWDSTPDVGGCKADGVRMRIKPVAAKAHPPATTEAFSLDNSVVDSDNDKLPDSWEWQVVDADHSDAITTVGQVLPGDDFDGDGRSNMFEYLTGTSPVHPASFFDAEFGLEPDGSLTLRWPTVPGKMYAVLSCEGLGTQWLPLVAAQPGTGGVLVFSDDAAGSPRRMRFYKVTVY